jgi:hypothetical protein
MRTRRFSCNVLNLVEMNAKLHTSADLTTRKELRNPLDRMVGEPRSWTGRYGGAKMLMPLPGIEPRTSSTSSVAT